MVFKTWAASSHWFTPIPAIIALLLTGIGSASGQVAPCPDPVPQTTGTYRFRQAGDSVNIPINFADCEPVALDLRWSNGANNGSNFIVTFIDDNNQPIYSKQLWGFMTGNQHFPFMNLETEPWLGNQSMIAVPVAATIQAVQPFRYPSSISYRVSRISRHPQATLRGIDDRLAVSLRIAPGKLLVETESSKSIHYRLEEIVLDKPRELDFCGRKEIVEKVYRLTLTGGKFSDANLLWIDDAALPAFWINDRKDVGALIYDVSILREGAEISLSHSDGTELSSLSERLKLPQGFKTTSQAAPKDGNAIAAVHNALRSIGASRQPLIQIELVTSRPFPVREIPLQLQIGKRFFVNELSGDHAGRTLTVSLTPEMFAELKDGADIIAFFNKPDRSGASDEDIWYFGRLNKRILSN